MADGVLKKGVDSGALTFQRSRAAVKVAIEDVLDTDLPESYTPELFQRKVEKVYEHVFDSYYRKKQSINRCQPWRAKRRLVAPSSREAALVGI